MTRKYFGTDGIRGLVGKAPITPDFVLKLGWAAGRIFARQGRSKILIGKDTRISGYMFESALEAGLSAAGVDVLLTGPMPTPAIAYLTRTFRADAGIVISASHNPHHDNGIKFFSGAGTKLPDEVEMAIEAQMDLAMTTVPSEELGKAWRIDDARGRYIEFCKGTAGGSLSLKGLRIVVDCAHGATYHVAPEVFEELGARVIPMGNRPDGININQGCGSTAPEAMRQRVLEEKADFGVAFDGDGDRLIMVDDQGEVVDGDELLFIIAQSMHAAGQLNGGVVGTLMSNLGLEQALARLDIPFSRAKVGDRYVMAELAEKGWWLGGESSGHLICRHLTSTGDGVVAALQVIRAVREQERSLAELKAGMTKFPQHMINVRLREKVDVMGLPAVQEAVTAATDQLAGKGRVLLRPSGTEPVVRVMAEGEDQQLVESVVEELSDAVSSAIGRKRVDDRVS